MSSTFVDPLGSVPALDAPQEQSQSQQQQQQQQSQDPTHQTTHQGRSPSPTPPPTPAKPTSTSFNQQINTSPPMPQNAFAPQEQQQFAGSSAPISSPIKTSSNGSQSPIVTQNTHQQVESPGPSNDGPTTASTSTATPSPPQQPHSSAPSNSHPHHPHPGSPRSPYISQPNPTRAYGDENSRSSYDGNQKPQPDPVLRVRVLGLERQRKDLWMKMDASTNISSYHVSYIKPFTRSYTEFMALHSALAANNPHTIIPALPHYNASTPNEEEEERLIRTYFQHWFDRICVQPSLMRDEELRMFLESSFGYTTVVQRKLKHNSFSSSSSSSSPFPKFRARSDSMKDENEELGTAKYEIVRLESSLLDVMHSVEKQAKARRSMAGSIRTVADSLAAYSTTESHKQASHTTKRLAGCMVRVAESEARHSVDDMSTLCDILAYESREAQEAKEALLHRQSLLEDHKAAIKNTIAKKRNMERLKGSSSIRAEKTDEAISELDEADRLERTLANRVKQVSQRLAPSLRVHMNQMNQDILSALANHGNASLQHEQTILRDLENILPELQNINPAQLSTQAVAPVVYAASNMAATSSTSSTRSIAAQSPPPTSSTSTTPGPVSQSASTTSLPSATTATGTGTGNQGRANRPGDERLSINGTKSMVLPAPNQTFRPGSHYQNTSLRDQQMIDERKRVDAKTAASKLANMF